MSHQPERSEKNCLNCGTEVAGRFCQQCGQENVAGHMPFFALVRHFVYDIFHFDGKFFETLKFLFFRPGFVPMQYVQGRRQSYLDPIRMYLFTSAVFFLVFFAVSGIGHLGNITGQEELSKAERYDVAAKLNTQNAYLPDTVLSPLKVVLDTSYEVVTNLKISGYVPEDSIYPVRWKLGNQAYWARKKDDKPLLTSNAQWLEKSLASKWERYKQQYDGDTDAMISGFVDKLVHRFPYLLFLSLPFFAAILKLLYLRRKKFFYFDHAVFTLYHYIFSFILLLLIIVVDALEKRFGWHLLSTLELLLIISWFVHLFVAMRRFYGQGRGRTFLKFVLLNLLASLALLLLFLCFIFYSVFTI